MSTETQTLAAIEARLAEIQREVAALGRMREEIEDLRADLTRVGKDLLSAACEELEGVACVTRRGEFTALLRNLLRNTANFNRLLNYLESGMDFIDDATPVARQAFQDVVQVLDRLDQRGWFEFLRELLRLADDLVGQFSAEDLRRLREALPSLVRAFRRLLQPGTLALLEQAAASLEASAAVPAETPSLFRLLRELNSPEARRTLNLAVGIARRLGRPPSPAEPPARQAA
ncbi:MAG: DUF1641 domain-containing protein [Verrucomicrobia bacterium]|nr:MAG: DUF1641 domain-containing protein [Verrucomicrobiota bacterium]